MPIGSGTPQRSTTTADTCDIPVFALKALVNHSMGSDVTAGYVMATPERLREPMQKVTDNLNAMISTPQVTALKSIVSLP